MTGPRGVVFCSTCGAHPGEGFGCATCQSVGAGEAAAPVMFDAFQRVTPTIVRRLCGAETKKQLQQKARPE